jgi:hypothetical protein
MEFESLFMNFISRTTRIISKGAGMGESQGRGKDHPLAVLAATSLAMMQTTPHKTNNSIRNTPKCSGLKVGYNDTIISPSNETIGRINAILLVT